MMPYSKRELELLVKFDKFEEDKKIQFDMIMDKRLEQLGKE